MVNPGGIAVSGDPYHFRGFDSPNYTPVPDVLFDELAPELTEAELRVLLYIIRRTFGFKRQHDAISLTQLVSGITTRDGRVLDHGTGMSRPGVSKGVKGLVEKGVILVDKVLDEKGENQANVYRLRFREGVVNEVNHPSERRFLPVGNDVAPQETGEQETGEQDFEISNGRPAIFDADGRTREALLPFAEDFGREFADQAPLAATLSRLVNLYQQSGRDLNDYIEVLYRARRITKERSAAIQGTAETVRGKAKMAYFFAVLEDTLTAGLERDAAGSRPRR
jgi:replication protein O